jgi:hypothetical protein
MVATAENVARDGAMSRAALDELTLLRWQQYQAALADDRRFQRRYLQPVVLPRGKGTALRVEADEGVHPYAGAWWPPGHLLGYEHSFTHEVRDLVAAVADGADQAPDFAAGLQVQVVLQPEPRHKAEMPKRRRARPCSLRQAESASRTCASSSATTRSPSTTCGSRSRPAFRWSG